MRPARREGRPTSSATPQLKLKSLSAPNGGLVLSEPLAQQSENSCLVLNNMFPTTRSVRIRAGSETFATIGFPVESMMTYQVGSNSQFFAAGGGGVYNITNSADPDIPPTADITGQVGNNYSSVLFGTAGGSFLYIVNGEDTAQYYDGTSWAASTITGVDTADLSHVSSYRNRLYFIEKESQSFWYLPVRSINGAALEFSLSSVFKRGGSLLFGATWSQDAGDGLDDKLVIVSDRGEVAIYEGSDPSDVTDFNLVGVYNITPPLGKNAYTSAGGDLVIMTQNGMVPISEAVRKEASVLNLTAVSRPIEPLWKQEVEFRTLPWQIAEIPKLNMAVVSLPSTGNLEAKCLVINLQTSRWGVYTGWDTRSVVEFDGRGFYGTNDGRIVEMEVGGSDDGKPYIYQCAYAANNFGSPGLHKTAKMGRATFIGLSNLRPQVSASVDYISNFPTPPNAGPEIGGESFWDVGLWDDAVWDGGLSKVTISGWFSIGRTGYAIIPQIQGTMANSTPPNSELVSIDMTYNDGGVHVR